MKSTVKNRKAEKKTQRKKAETTHKADKTWHFLSWLTQNGSGRVGDRTHHSDISTESHKQKQRCATLYVILHLHLLKVQNLFAISSFPYW